MAIEHDKLVDEAIKTACVVACREEIRRHGNGLTMSPFDRTGGSPEKPLFRWQRHIAEQRPIVCAVISEIAERTKEATIEMCATAAVIEPKFPVAQWSAMHAASALWPSCAGVDDGK
jgi:hypothetical protein